jgi:hypothetical protein
MKQKNIQLILAIVIGIVALVIVSMSLMALFTSIQSFSIVYALLIAFSVFLVFGIGVGLFWRDGHFRAGIVLASPFVAVTLLSVLFSGYFQKFLTNDLPILITAVVAGAIGCFFGQKIGPRLRSDELN